MSDFEEVGGLVGLPRFSVSYGSCLNGPLKEMGMAVPSIGNALVSNASALSPVRAGLTMYFSGLWLR